MRTDLVVNLAIAVAMTVVIALITGAAWPAWVMGAVLALSLAVGAGTSASATTGRIGFRLTPLTYAVGAGITIALGLVFGGTEVTAMWSVGAVLAIAISPFATKAVDDARADRSAAE